MARGRNPVRYGVFMLSRTNDSEPVDRIIIAVRLWKNAVVTALASVTPSGIPCHFVHECIDQADGTDEEFPLVI
jgi:hypothetical protein